MNYKKILPIIAFSTLLFGACRDNIMDWEKDPAKGEIEVSEIPLQLWEKIIRYDSLKSYTDLILGAGVGMTQYMDGGTYHDLAVQNFDNLTVGYAMKHGPMVNSSGDIVYGPVDAFIAKAKADGMTIYGHTLVWHSNQNASYLNGIIAPTILPAPPGENILDLSSLEDGSFTDWGNWNNGDGITVEENEGLLDGTKAVKLIASSTSSNPWDLQLISPTISVDTTHEHLVSFYIKSDIPGQGRLSFNGLYNNYPNADWIGTGDSTSSFTTDATWQQIKIRVSDFKGGEEFKVAFDLGYQPGVTYYIDVENIYVVDLDNAEAGNLISNGNFESGSLDPWTGWGNGSSREISAEGEGYGGTGYAMVLTNPTVGDNIYSAQQVYTFSSPLEQDKEYTCTFMVKADVAATLQVQVQSEDYSANYYGGISVGTNWSQIKLSITPTTADRIKFVFDFAATAATFYIDDILFTDGSVGGEPIIIEVPEEEKTARIGAAMESFISGMVSHYKNDIKAWDVVNEPMLENGEVRNGNVPEEDLADDHFYWQKYLGEEYAVTAFNLARQYGNPDDILFINDYNLESNMTKLDGLIQYVQEIESQGATVDGIGTQMHISYNSDTTLIVQMFEKLAASGKLIKITELDVRLGTASPTASLLEDQANMYRFVIDSYMKIIPEAQQYSITIWGISDNEDEHEYWLPEESPNLWDANYERKHAYKGAADGLAGRDVSEDFTGDLDY